MNAVKFVNIPPEVISIIVQKQNLSLTDLKSFKAVCLSNQYLYYNLYDIVIQDIRKKGILKINLYNSDDRVAKFLADYQILTKSKMKVSIELPGKDQLSQQLQKTLIQELGFKN